MIVFSVVIIGLIGLAAKFALPEYYFNHQMNHIQTIKEEIYENYDINNPDLVFPLMEQLKTEVGGELYYYTDQGIFKGSGKGRNAMINNSEKFISGDSITEYTYENKIGLEIFVIGIDTGDEYLVYEVSVQSLDDAVGVMLEFIWILLIMVLIVAIIVAVLLSNNIAKPIRKINELAKTMKDKKVESVMITGRDDEIGQLNQSLNELYEELLNNIFMLETELQKERKSENLKKRFLAQATHELKTPISVIRGYAEILYDGMYKDEVDRDRYLKNIYDESESISHLILDVLDYTKMETGNYKLEKQTISAQLFYDGLVQRYKGFIETNGLVPEIKVNIPDDLIVSVDTNRIEQVFTNLVSNAVEHGISKVSISVQSLGGGIKLCVANDGASIDSDDLPFIFDSFYKKKGKQKGTGLGLAIVKEIVMLHKGEYRAENTKDGVRFVVTFY